jgi:hypothetical protein
MNDTKVESNCECVLVGLSDVDIEQFVTEFGYDANQLHEAEAEFDGAVMLELFKGGEIVKRKSEQYGYKLDVIENCDQSIPAAAMIDENGKMVAMSGFTVEQLLATDWQIIRF